MKISFYPNTFSKDNQEADAVQVINAIYNGTWGKEISYLRSVGKNEYDSEKKKLPAVTWSGTFQPGTRSIETLVNYSQLVCLDIDKLDEANINYLQSNLTGDEHVITSFISPSGTGVKILVKVNTGPEHHRAAFLHLQKVFEEKYLIKVDPSGKDVCRLCYVSSDNTMVVNTEFKVFEVDTKYGEVTTVHRQAYEQGVALTEAQKVFDVCTIWIKKKYEFVEGSRNMYIHAMACALNRCGVKQDDAIALITRNLSTPDDKWHQSVRSAYFHNQVEHGSYQVKDIGAIEFVAPPYVANFTDDVVANDIMRTTAMLFTHKVPNELITDYVSKLARYYDNLGYIDMRRNNLFTMMNQAVTVLNQNIAQQSAQHALGSSTAEQLANELIGLDMTGVLPIHLSWFDEALGGGIMPGTFWGLIGFGGTFKSILINYMAYMDAINDIPVLVLNGEMSVGQYYERFVQIVLGKKIRQMQTSGEVSKGTVEPFIQELNRITKGNIFVYSGSGYTKKSILAELDYIYATTGKRVRRVYMDGLAQMDWAGREEIQANIANSFIGKEIAKEAFNGEGVVLMALIHCSGDENKVIRNTGNRIRGGSKLLANMDGYLCTSLFIDPETINPENPDDFQFIPSKFHLLMMDKRSGADQVRAVINVGKNLSLEIENQDPKTYEVKIQRQH